MRRTLLAVAMVALTASGCASTVTGPGGALGVTSSPDSSSAPVGASPPGPTGIPGGAGGGVWAAMFPGLPGTSAARTELAALTVAPRTHADSYKRDLFKTWDIISGRCDTRETVLKRDGRDVQTSASCAATAGTWVSPYDGRTWTRASDVDIDHVVPLGNAWASGAWAWSADKREKFANDLTDPQLVAVTDNVNESKGDRAPDEWKPPSVSFYCVYAEAWVRVKYVWQLTVTDAEKAALSEMLATC